MIVEQDPGEHLLSRREREIARLYSDGQSYRQIGARLFIAPSTVRTHLGSIYRKLGVSSKIDLLRRLDAAERQERRPEADGPEIGAAATVEVPEPPANRRPMVAVLPLSVSGTGRDTLADGLTHDIISRLARLRGARVIARGSVFSLRERGVSDDEAARLLGADYLAVGSLARSEREVAVTMDLVDVGASGILWSETFTQAPTDTLAALDEIVDKIVGSLAGEIETAERGRAMGKHLLALDAWESFHRGLWYMYRFTAPDNERAQLLFRRAVELDPTFARGHAGLSFTHFQNAFLLRPEDRRSEIAKALASARRGLEADERDPSAHWALGRARWLDGDDAGAVAELETSVGLSPSFSLGHYALAFVNSQAGDPAAAVRASARSQRLSPFDPLLFGMMGARAMALLRLGAFGEAADWAVKAAARPNAHVHILAIAAHCLEAADRSQEARSFVALIQRSQPGYSGAHFLAAFRFPHETQVLFRKLAARIGL